MSLIVTVVLPEINSIVNACYIKRDMLCRQDIEFEMERFLGEYKEKTSKYTYISEVPKGPLQDQATLAVDAIARLVLPIQDGDAIEEADASLVEDVVVGGMLGYEGADIRQCVGTSISTRQERGNKYV